MLLQAFPEEAPRLLEAVAYLTKYAVLAEQQKCPISSEVAMRLVNRILGAENREPTEEEQRELDVNGCRALLLEIVRRAASDWILYRTVRKADNKKLAEDAFVWLFEEDEEHYLYLQREAHERITSFVGICEALDIDPDKMREHIKKLTAKDIVAAGRPRQYRRATKPDKGGYFSVDEVLQTLEDLTI